MSPIYGSILCPLLLAFFCEAYPAASEFEETLAESFAQFLDQREKFKSDIMDLHMEDRKLPEGVKEVPNLLGMGNEDSPPSFYQKEIEDYNDYALLLDKRAASRGKYNYYKCYFNPVTCYRK